MKEGKLLLDSRIAAWVGAQPLLGVPAVSVSNTGANYQRMEGITPGFQTQIAFPPTWMKRGPPFLKKQTQPRSVSGMERGSAFREQQMSVAPRDGQTSSE